MVQKSPSRDADKYVVRFPDGLRDKLAAHAKENGRSLNSEIVARLEVSMVEAGDVSAYGLNALIRRLEAHADVTEAVAQKLYYELALANGVGLEEHESITAALDAYIASLPAPEPARPQAIRAIVTQFLIDRGFARRPKDSRSE